MGLVMIDTKNITPLLETLFETSSNDVCKGLDMYIKERFCDYPEDLAWDIEAIREATHVAIYRLLFVMDSATLGSSASVLDYLRKENDIQGETTTTDFTDISELRMESQLECFKCKEAGKYCRNVETQEKQTRSADESATVFATCLNCRSRWKFAL